MNRFLIYNDIPDLPVPHRVYSLLDSMEPEAPALDEPVRALYDCVDADWFDHNWTAASQNDQFFDKLPLTVLEIEFPNALAMEMVGLRMEEEEDQRRWMEIAISDETTAQPLQQYRTLFDPEPRQRFLRRVETPSPDALTRLQQISSMDDLDDADKDDLRGVLSGPSGIEFATVYDVGQGNWNGLCDSAGTPSLYFDFGGGVLGNTFTFPGALTAFCHTNDPPVVLSHWDWDHWSSAQRFTGAHALTWIVPRQQLGAVHRTFAQIVLQSGKLLVWPSGLATMRSGQLRIEKCTGHGRNHSGLAMVASEPNGSQEMLFTGDARYSVIPSGSNRSFSAVVVPHHGADMRNRTAPACPGRGHNRLAYSFGRRNTFRHPRAQTQRDHQNQGWNHAPPVGGAPPTHVIETQNRGTNSLGHIALHWRQVNNPRQPPCNGRSCDLQISQW